MRHDADGARRGGRGRGRRTIPTALRRALASPRSGLPLPGLSRPVRPGASRPSLGGGRADDAVEPRAAVSPPPPRGPRGGLSGRSTARRRAASSGGRTAGCCRRSRHRPRCQPIQSRPCGRTTTRRGCACTRGRHAHPRWGSAWMWATRSTSCIPWPREAWDRHSERGNRPRQDDRLRSARSGSAPLVSRTSPYVSDTSCSATT